MATATEINATIDAERTRLTREILAEIDAHPIKTDHDRSLRLGLALAARIVKRGRNAEASEKLANLANALAEYPEDEAD